MVQEILTGCERRRRSQGWFVVHMLWNEKRWADRHCDRPIFLRLIQGFDIQAETTSKVTTAFTCGCKVTVTR